ncbi:MAG: transposase [Candidatus Azobacteroides sp.]|nr:transposase [Candidatus Azobacteroides sp.]
MAVIVKTCTYDGTIPEYICNECKESEGGRVRGVAYINKDLQPVITETNVKSRAWWENNIVSGAIIIIPTTRGTYDGGAKQTVTGYGDEQEKIIKKTHTAVINDSNHFGNELFYEYLENNYKDYIFAFRTEKELRIATDVLTGLEAKDNVEEDTNTEVVWQATVTWDQSRPKMIVPVYELTNEVKELFKGCIGIEP